MALTKWYTFEEGTSAATIGTGGDYVAVSGAPTYDSAAAHHGAMGMLSTSGSYLTLLTNSVDNGAFSFYLTLPSTTTGVPRAMTFTDSANAFIAMFRPHTDGKFDIADGSSTRQASSSYTWVAGTKYRVDGFLGGSGTSRTVDLKVFIGEDNASPVWTSGSVAVTSSTANPWVRTRVGGQGATAGTIRIDDVRFFDTQVHAGPVPDTVLEFANQGAVTGSAASSFTPTIAAFTPGAYIFLIVAWTTSAATFSQSGWTELGVLTTDSTITVGVFFRKKPVGATTTVFTTQSGRGCWVILAYPNLDPTTPYQTFTTAANMLKKNTAGATIPTPAVVNSLATAWALAVHALRTSTVGNKAITFTPDGALTERQDANMSASTSSPWTAVEAADSNGAVTAASHSYTATANFSETHGGGGLIYLNPWQATTVTDLVVANIAQAQGVSAPAMTQEHQLVVAGVAQVQFIQAPALAQVHELAVDGTAQTQALQQSAVTQVHQLAVDGLLQTPFIQAPVPISQEHHLDVSPVNQTQAFSSPALTQVHAVAVAGLAQAQALSSPSLSGVVDLVVAGLVQGQALASAVLAQAHQLAANGIAQPQQASSPSLAGGSTLVVAGINQGQQLGTPLLGQLHHLVVAAMAQAQQAGSPQLGQVHDLAVQGVTQQQALAALILSIVPDGGYSEAILTATHVLTSSLTAAHPQPDLTVTNAPSSQLEVSHGL